MSKTRPNISVVIPSYAGKKLLQKHLPDVLEQLIPGDEVIVVDDASPEPDDTMSWLETQAEKHEKNGITIVGIQHVRNQRFAATVNTGVQAATKDIIWLLNNDVSPLTDKSVEKAQYWFDQDKKLFAIGCAEVQTSSPNAQKFGRGTGNFRRGLLVHWYDSEQTLPTTLWTAGGSMFVDREKYLELGGMDQLFAPAYEEDRDLSYRALKRGWNIRHDVEIVVHHQHETTNTSVFGQRAITIASWKNQFLIVWKNIGDWSLLAQHLLWLPYHLVITNWREKGAVGLGFWQALQRWPKVLAFRRTERANWKKNDHDILQTHGSTPPQTHLVGET